MRWRRESARPSRADAADEGQVIRCASPSQQERRKELVKVAHKYAEAARVAIPPCPPRLDDVLKKLEKDLKR